MAIPLHTPLVFLTAVVALGVGGFAWYFRETPGARFVAVLMAAVAVWAFGDGMALASPTLEGKVVWTRVAWSVSGLVPLAWLGTVLAHADRDWRLDGRQVAVLLVEPVAFLALVWTNGDHELVWTDFSTDIVGGSVVLTREFGLAFWAHHAYSYFLVAVGCVVLVGLNFRTNRRFRSQNTALLVAAAAPLFANTASVSGLLPPQYDLTALGFVVTGLAVAAAVFREDLLTVAPATRKLGRETVVDDMDDEVLILDAEGRVVDLNPAAERLLGTTTDEAVGRPLAAVDRAFGEAVAALETGQAELELDGADGRRYYDARVSTLEGAYPTTSGRVVSLRDVTDRRQREQRLDVLNRLLRHNLRNEMNVVGGNVELLAEDLDAADPTVRKRLAHIEETIDTMVERGEKVGRLSRDLDGDGRERVSLAPTVRDAVSRVRENAPGATVTVEVPEGVVVAGGRALELAIEELVENAVEHGDPPVTVTAAATGDGYAELRVADEGPGIARQERAVIEKGRETDLEHGSGVGLWLVLWAVREYGGTVGFDDRTDGTTVVVRLPGERTTGSNGAETVTPEDGTREGDSPAGSVRDGRTREAATDGRGPDPSVEGAGRERDDGST
ncbi:histidine kinase [Halobacteriales archaeon QH_7_68_42]|nr:MAG: histidine kinase [Halobacteriales archaeon QH_7_68_42]